MWKLNVLREEGRPRASLGLMLEINVEGDIRVLPLSLISSEGSMALFVLFYFNAESSQSHKARESFYGEHSATSSQRH